MNLNTVLYAIGLYLATICFGVYLNHAHGESNPENTSWPRIAGSYTGKIPPPSKSCQDYLTICEKSCTNRGEMFRFLCLGQGFNPDSERYRCQCADEAFSIRVQQNLAFPEHHNQ
jgi:hypothetical protein